MKIVVVGTHSSQTTGYARVMRHMIPELAKHASIAVYGIQSCGPGTLGDQEFDAHALERQSGLCENGFMFSGLAEFVRSAAPDFVMIYNDPVVSGEYVARLARHGVRVPVVLYVDLVYSRIHESHWDLFRHPLVVGAFVMSECWKRELETIPGFHKPVHVATHATTHVRKIPRSLARSLVGFEFGDDVVTFLNMNRNTHRKRLDLFVAAAARYLSNAPDAPVRFLVNSHHEETYDLRSIAIRELAACGVHSTDVGRLVDKIMINRVKLTDDRVTELYNACDVVVNCAEGEGFGLCVAEGASVGKPVIVSNVGGAADLFATGSPTAPRAAYTIPPVAGYYVDGRDGIGGYAQLVDVNDIVRAIDFFMIEKNRETYGRRARELVSRRPSWDDVAEGMIEFFRYHVTSCVRSRS